MKIIVFTWDLTFSKCRFKPILIIRDTFWPISDSPPCVIWWHCLGPLPCVMWYFSFSQKNKFFFQGSKEVKIENYSWQKMSCDKLVDHLPPLPVLFGDSLSVTYYLNSSIYRRFVLIASLVWIVVVQEHCHMGYYSIFLVFRT